MRWCVVALGLCGCDALFGLTRVPTAAPDATRDAPGLPITVTGTVTRRFLHNDATGMPVLEQVPVTSSPIAVRDHEGNALALTFDNGAFSFEVPAGERYHVIQRMSVFTVEYQLASPMLALDDIVLGHPVQQTPGSAAVIEWDTTETTLNAQDLRFATTGVWSGPAPTEIGTASGKFMVNSSTAGFYSGQQPALLSAAAHDGLIVMHIATSTTAVPMNRVFDRYSAFSFNQAANSTSTLISTLASVPQTFCDDIYWNHSREQQRFAQLYPAFGAELGDTRLWAMPLGREIGIHAPYELALAFSNQGDSHFQFHYGNPFGYDVLTLDDMYVTRTLSNGTVIGNYAQYVDAITPSTTCMARPAPATPAPFAFSPTLDGVPLTDNVTIGSDGTTPLELHWSVDMPAPNTVTQVNIIQGAALVRQYITLDETVVLDPRDFTNGTQYRLQIVPSVGSFPGAASGDFTSHGYPVSVGIYSSGLFSIAKP